MTLSIRYYGDPVLKEKGVKVDRFDDQLSKLANDMLALMHLSDGIGLAAQQVGLALQFCVMEIPDHPDYPITSRTKTPLLLDHANVPS